MSVLLIFECIFEHFNACMFKDCIKIFNMYKDFLVHTWLIFNAYNISVF